MGERLFPNIKKMTTTFCLAIVFLTIGLFALRMTVFSDMVMVEDVPLPSHEITVSGMAFTYRLANTVEFASPDARGDITVENDEENSFYMRLEIIHDISGLSIYLSPFLAPGQEISAAYLQGIPLEAGEHRSTATVTVYNPGNRRQLGSQTHPVTIRIG